MSTFDGVISEFPHIRIDCFKARKGYGGPQPLACFLSHVHSDHLTGLESHKGVFVYCSTATREILLRLTRLSARRAHLAGLTEQPVHQPYKHLAALLKPIPLNTPTPIELAPGNDIRVTLLDANHCAGAVMFLIEAGRGRGGPAVLYTGDVRAEKWWVEGIARNPVLRPYVAAGGEAAAGADTVVKGERLKVLDRVYLDTTFAQSPHDHSRSLHFAAKAAGISELLAKIARYPPDTVFLLHAWTFGYEDVLIALAAHLSSRIHVDAYRWRVYSSLRGVQGANEGPALVGCQVGNSWVEGCLTNEPHGMRVHACEKESGCPIVETCGPDVPKSNPDIVHIIPIVARAGGAEIREMGLGGGMGDLDGRRPERETLIRGGRHLAALVDRWMAEARAATGVTGRDVGEMRWKMIEELSKGVMDGRWDERMQVMVPVGANGRVELREGVPVLYRALVEEVPPSPPPTFTTAAEGGPGKLPRTITFPYARHSSLSELRHLLEVLRPRDVWPCTTVEVGEGWSPEVGMGAFFGGLRERGEEEGQDSVRGEGGREWDYEFDRIRGKEWEDWMARFDANELETQKTQERESESESEDESLDGGGDYGRLDEATDLPLSSAQVVQRSLIEDREGIVSGLGKDASVRRPDGDENVDAEMDGAASGPDGSIRGWAFTAVRGTEEKCRSWASFGGLDCVKRKRNDEVELG